MKKTIIITTLLCFALNLSAEEIEVKGYWKKIKTRSLIIEQDPTPPVVYINNNNNNNNNKVLSIYMEDVISNLCIIITDIKGNIVYQDYISTNRPEYTYSIRLKNLPEGDYSITLSHEYGILVGWFEM